MTYEPKVCPCVYVFGSVYSVTLVLFPYKLFFFYPIQMTQNMFQEGLYHVFFKETPSTSSPTQDTSHGELRNARIHRWFGTIVNTRLLVTGVRCYSLVFLQTTGSHSFCKLLNFLPALYLVLPLRWCRSSVPWLAY